MAVSKSGGIIGAVVALGAATWYFVNPGKIERSPSEQRTTALGSEQQLKTSDPNAIGVDATAGTLPPPRPRLALEYGCNRGNCAESPFIASSAAEAKWLQSNGFPTRRQRDEAIAASTIELRRRAEAGALSDMALYGERLAAEGQWDQSLGVLGNAVARGSIYTLYSISDVYAKSPKHLNPIQSQAFLRAAYLAGDSKATYVLSQRFSEFDSAPEKVMIDKEAARIHRNFLKHRMSPRPG